MRRESSVSWARLTAGFLTSEQSDRRRVFLDRTFKRIDSAFSREDGSPLFETRLSRAFQGLVNRHMIIGTIVQSACMAVALGIFFLLVTGFRFPREALLVLIVSFIAFAIWMGLYNRWRAKNSA